MAITGVFEGDGTRLADEPWFPSRIEMEFGSLGGSGAGVMEVLDLGPTTRFPKKPFLALQAALQSRSDKDVIYAVEVVLPANWPWGEPICYVLDPSLRYDTRIEGNRIPHIYGERPYTDCLCTHVSGWDTENGTSSLGAYLYCVAIWLGCFEEFLRRPGNFGYWEWSRYADKLMRQWRGKPV